MLSFQNIRKLSIHTAFIKLAKMEQPFSESAVLDCAIVTIGRDRRIRTPIALRVILKFAQVNTMVKSFRLWSKMISCTK
jgi:hypothetical protein